MKAKQLLLPVIMMVSVALLTACAPDISPENYQTSQAGQAANTVRGTIIAATPVKVTGAPGMMSGVGTLGGAAVGGVAGSAIGGGWRSNLLGGIGGAVLGGLAGNYAESKLTSQTGIQYQVQLKSGSIVSVTQGSTPLLTVGEHVFVIYGSGQTRVIPNTSGQ